MLSLRHVTHMLTTRHTDSLFQQRARSRGFFARVDARANLKKSHGADVDETHVFGIRFNNLDFFP